MHIFFSGIGGAGIGPLAMVAKQAGYKVSGSDKQNSNYIEYLKKHGIKDIHIGQSKDKISQFHTNNPIDWFVYSSAVEKENANHPELLFVREQGIYTSKRDELLNKLLLDKKQKLIAIAGTHGKTTTTAMTVWLLKQLKISSSYILPAKTNFADMGHYENKSQYFVYECDEFDRNFLAYTPYLSLITGVSWDHHEIFPTREDYQEAFKEFISQSEWTYIWQEDYDYLNINKVNKMTVLESEHPHIKDITITGLYNRLDAWLVIQGIHEITKAPIKELINHMNKFPGLQRRMEKIIENLFSDYAHTPEKIRGCMSAATELANQKNQKVIVVYEPLTNRRQHYMKEDYKDCFSGAEKVYWIPSYLAREDPNQEVLSPSALIKHLSDPSIAEALERDEKLKGVIQEHLNNGDMVVAMAGGGGGSLDEWIRKEFK